MPFRLSTSPLRYLSGVFVKPLSSETFFSQVNSRECFLLAHLVHSHRTESSQIQDPYSKKTTKKKERQNHAIEKQIGRLRRHRLLCLDAFADSTLKPQIVNHIPSSLLLWLPRTPDPLFNDNQQPVSRYFFLCSNSTPPNTDLRNHTGHFSRHFLPLRPSTRGRFCIKA